VRLSKEREKASNKKKKKKNCTKKKRRLERMQAMWHYHAFYILPVPSRPEIYKGKREKNKLRGNQEGFQVFPISLRGYDQKQRVKDFI